MSESIRYREIYEALKSEILGGEYVPKVDAGFRKSGLVAPVRLLQANK